MIDSKELLRRFTYHKPTEQQVPKYEEIRGMALAYAERLVVLCPPSRELSLALTHLEDVVYCANAAIARNE